jgi:alkylation response protein AidB-like acyl-CoA dehydrogenase
MTETTGGSDVSGLQTTATYVPPIEDSVIGRDEMGEPLGPWVINGFKWFTSGTEASMAIVLARTSKGLTAFYVPTRHEVLDDDGNKVKKMNGIDIIRLKAKMGTKALPTAELRLNGCRGYMLGEEGQGLKLAVESLNIARVYCAIAAMGLCGRGLAINRAFSQVRKIAGGRRLDEVPLFVRGLAKLHVAYRANMLFTFFVIALLGRAEHPTVVTPESPAQAFLPKNPQDTQLLLRLFTSVLKPTTAKYSIGALQDCMENLGGIGYLENDEMEVNIARLYRDANVSTPTLP